MRLSHIVPHHHTLIFILCMMNYMENNVAYAWWMRRKEEIYFVLWLTLEYTSILITKFYMKINFSAPILPGFCRVGVIFMLIINKHLWWFVSSLWWFRVLYLALFFYRFLTYIPFIVQPSGLLIAFRSYSHHFLILPACDKIWSFLWVITSCCVWINF